MKKVEFDSATCIHAGNCVSGLPEVFSVKDGQFVINLDGADEERIRDQVQKCPSGALHIIEN